MSVVAEESVDATAIRPFTIDTPEADLQDLRAADRGHALARKGDCPG